MNDDNRRARDELALAERRLMQAIRHRDEVQRLAARAAAVLRIEHAWFRQALRGWP